MPYYDFTCPKCGVFEASARREQDAIECACGESASRRSVYRIGFTGFARTPQGQNLTGQDYRRYKEAADTLAYQKDRFEDSAQVRFPDPPLYQIARDNAKSLSRAGVTADQITT